METSILESQSEQLQQCAAIIAQGSYAEWIMAALTIGLFTYTAFSKKNVPVIIRDVFGVLLKVGERFKKGKK